MNRQTWTHLLFMAVAALLVWNAAAELPAPARLWTTLLVAVLPVITIRQAGLEEQALAMPRGAIYLQSAILLWMLAGATGVVAAAADVGADRLGLVVGDPALLALATVATLAAGLAFVVAAERLGLEEPPVVRHLLPVTNAEKVGFAGLSLTAGFCEELVFRGFLIDAIIRSTGQLSIALLISSALFGVLHAYQRPAGAARAGALGLLLAAPLVLTGSLWPSIFAHAGLDLAAGFWLRDRIGRG